MGFEFFAVVFFAVFAAAPFAVPAVTAKVAGAVGPAAVVGVGA
jgi:hypothetical protein